MDTPSPKPRDNPSFSFVSSYRLRFLYLILVFLRIGGSVFLFFSSYIHPDEYFQSIEITNSLDPFGRQGKIPWEFANCTHPCRSIVSPFMLTGVPTIIVYGLARLTNERWVPFTNTMVMISIRLWMTIVSLMIDGIVLTCIRKLTRYSSTSSSLRFTTYFFLYLLTSWPAELFSTRTFSNTMENWCFVIFIYGYDRLRTSILYNQRTNIPSYRSILSSSLLLGSITIIGCWTRFTFTIFSFTFMLSLILLLIVYPWIYPWFIKTNVNSLTNTTIPNLSRLRQDSIVAIFSGSLSSIVTVIFVTVLDSLFFGTVRYTYPFTFRGSFIFTPWNSFKYNLQVDNLALHGLHPFYNHIFVNMFLMYGPGWFMVLVYVLYSIGHRIRRQFRGNDGHVSLRNVWERMMELSMTIELSLDHFRYLCTTVVVVSLFLLSLAPHQEPRFLVPLMYPIGFLISYLGIQFSEVTNSLSGSGYKVFWRSICRPFFIFLWLVFNLGVGLFFGNIHQNGIVTSLFILSQYKHINYQNPPVENSVMDRALPSSSSIPFPILSYVRSYKLALPILLPVKDVLFYSTYTPPHSILWQPRTGNMKNNWLDTGSIVAPWCRDQPSYANEGTPRNPSFSSFFALDTIEVNNSTVLLSKFIRNSQRNYGTLIVTPHHLVPDINQLIRSVCLSSSSNVPIPVCDENDSEFYNNDYDDNTNTNVLVTNSSSSCLSSVVPILYPLYSIWPHISTEAWPSNVNDAALDILYASCST